MPVSALEETGLAQSWDQMQALADWRRTHGHWAATRAAQAAHWFEEEVRSGLLARLDAPEVRARMQALAREVTEGRRAARAAAADLLDTLERGP